jgi:hypothetical protein
LLQLGLQFLFVVNDLNNALIGKAGCNTSCEMVVALLTKTSRSDVRPIYLPYISVEKTVKLIVFWKNAEKNEAQKYASLPMLPFHYSAL